jgi:hypothetical protein
VTTFAPPYAGVLCSINGAPPSAGPQTSPSTSATIQFSASNATGWTTGLWEIYDYPPGYATPSGWSLDAASGAIYYNATQATPNPPVCTQQFWGKIGCRLTVDDGIDPTGLPNAARLIDTSCAVEMASPHGLLDMFAGEDMVFGLFRSWVGDHKTNLRTLEAFLAAGSGAYTSPPAPQLFTAAGTVVFSGAIQAVGIDTSAAGSYNVTVPAATNGQVMEVDDHNGTWVAHGVPGLIVPNNVWIENPIGSALVLGNVGGTNVLALPAASGIPRTSLRWKYYSNTTTHPLWKLS